MAYASDIKTGLLDIAISIKRSRQDCKDAKAKFANAVTDLNGLPTIHAELIAAVNALGNSAYEQTLKAELTALTAEFTALRNASSAAVTALAGTTEF